MALWPISEMDPCYVYRTCDAYPCTWFFNYLYPNDTRFCKSTLYSEMFSRQNLSTTQFFYVPSTDEYWLMIIFDNCWVSWQFGIPVPYRATFAFPASGGNAVMISADFAVFLVSFWMMLATGIEVGSYGKLYCTSLFTNISGIFEVDPGTLNPPANAWGVAYTDLTGIYTIIPGFYSAEHSIVNREDGIVMINVGGSADMHFWDIKSVPHVYLGKMTAPGAIADVSYEDRYRFWVVTRDGYLQKINYHLLRTELLSEIEVKAPTDINYAIAWDQKRFRLAVFTHKPDAADGACTSTITYYRPLPKINLLTDPVPIRPLRYGKRIPFSFHLVGTAGEGISPYMVDAVLEAPIDGRLERGSAGTGQNGIGGVEYVAPNLSCEETLQLQATITDGD